MSILVISYIGIGIIVLAALAAVIVTFRTSN